MIIGNNNDNKFKDNNFLKKSTFENKFKRYKENSNLNKSNIFVKDIKDTKYTNVSSSDDMYNKSIAMLNDRLQNGLITMDEFNKQINALAKKRRK